MGSMKLKAAGLRTIYEQLLKARFMESPYENLQLVWEEDTLWKTVIENANLQVDISVDYVRNIVRSHHDMFLKDPSLPEVDNDSLRSLVATFFKPMPDRGHGQLEKTNKHIEHPTPPPPPQYTPPNYGLKLVQALDRLKDQLRPQELRWIEETITQGVVHAQYFLAMTDPQKLEYIKRRRVCRR
ncbi:hypothetical protein M5689_012214 [Euphorbia peplus]|nr:hypothetical protein M5689_012214 [Euphorbia peplus]